ncbi:MAG: MATE family efflux transporter [Endomicrobium sp.]|jgi:MATE family multidrug resistance protein|nr:MATE family efflux transporter [Endomicrobium sp.]
MSVIDSFKERYKTAGGYAEFLKISIPLIASTGIEAVQLFINKIFLSRYSQESFIASTPAGIINWSIVCFFFGTLTYIDIFIAQYYGQKRYKEIGPAIWQGIYLAFIATCIIFLSSIFAKSFFMSIGHPYDVACEEVKYFTTLCYGSFPCIAETVFAGFYAGIGKTKIVLIVSLCGVITNIILDFCLIYGHYGLPNMGITGAALANNISLFIVCIIYTVLIVSKKNSNIYNTRNIKPNFTFIKRLLCYGLPNGGEFFFDTIGFGIFIIIIGHIGIYELAASNIVATIHHILSVFIVGCGMSTSLIVGKYVGKNNICVAKSSVQSAIHIVSLYILIVFFCLILFPNKFIMLFASSEQSVLLDKIRPMLFNLLRMLAFYLIFNASNIIFSSAIKGAGDTIFIVKKFILFSILFIIIPTYISVIFLKLSIYIAWSFVLLYNMALSLSFYYRYKSQRWTITHLIGKNNQ